MVKKTSRKNRIEVASVFDLIMAAQDNMDIALCMLGANGDQSRDSVAGQMQSAYRFIAAAIDQYIIENKKQ